MLYLVLKSKKKKEFLTKVVEPLLSGAEVSYRVMEDVNDISPRDGDVVLLFGQSSTRSLREAGFLHKSLKVSTLRDKAYSVNGVPVLVTFDPWEMNTVPDRRQLIQCDIRLAIRLHETGSLEPDLSEKEYHFVTDLDAVVESMKYQIEQGQRPLLSFDLETVGLDPFAPEAKIVSMSFSFREGESHVLPYDRFFDNERVQQQVVWLLSELKIKLIGANLKFDANWMALHCGIEIKNLAFDVGVVASLIDENRKNNLNLLAKLYTEMGGYDDRFNLEHDKGRMDKVLEGSPDEFLTYAGGDTDTPLLVYGPLRAALLDDRRLATFYLRVINPASHALSLIEQRGVLVDTNQYELLREEVQEEIDRLNKEMLALVPDKIRDKHKDDLRLSRPTVIRDLFFSRDGFNLPPLMLTDKRKEISTSREHLMMFHEYDEVRPFIELLGEYNSATKMMSTYVEGFLKHLRSDGRFHPSYNLYVSDLGGTVTGRLSAKWPAWQTLVKHSKWAKPLRKCFPPPPGYVVLKLDYSQGELRVTACVANEPTMLRAYKSGMDLHSITAAKLNTMTLEKFLKLPKEKINELRFGGKAGNFGLIYGMSAEGFVEYARDTYQVYLTLEKAVNFREDFFRLYPALLDWHELAKNVAHQHGYVRSPLGRVRHLPLINSPVAAIRSKQERQAINSPIQSCLSDMMLYALGILAERYPELWCFGSTHDEAQFYVPENEVELWRDRIKEVMENLPLGKLGWNPQLPFITDAEASAISLGHCEEI